MWKVIKCPECETEKAPKFLEIEKACGKMECANEACKHVWWEHPWGKSCQHRKVSKADVEKEVERLNEKNQII